LASFPSMVRFYRLSDKSNSALSGSQTFRKSDISPFRKPSTRP